MFFLDHAGDLHVAAHDRVQLPFPGRLREVVAELLDVKFLLFARFLPFFLLFVPLGGLLILPADMQQTFAFHEGEHPAVVHSAAAEEGLAVAVRSAAQGEQQMVRGGLLALQPGCLHYRDTQNVLRLTGEIDMVDFRVGNRLVGKDAAVDEALQFGRFHAESLQHLERGVLLVTDDPEEQMVGTDSVAAGAHGLLAGIFDDAVQSIGNLNLHR